MQFTSTSPSLIPTLILTSFISTGVLSASSIPTTHEKTASNSHSPGHCLRSSPLSTNLACSSTGTGTRDLVSLINHHQQPRTNINLNPLQVDTTNPFFPWSYEPICVTTTTHSSSGDGTLEDLELCVYTNASFSNGRGISIFTTPEIADEFALLPPFTDATSLNGINGQSHHQTQEQPWYTQALPNKGIGMLARHALNRTNLITAYTPVLLVYLDRDQEMQPGHGQGLSMLEKERLLRIAINQLPPPTREAYLALGTLYGDVDLVVQDVMKANTFEVEIAGEGHLALVPETSRINHACNPNSQYYFDTERLTHFVHAARPIAPGEEITISYTDPFSPTLERHSHLASSFHFTCTCPRCTHAHTSDTNLALISSTRAHLSNWDDGTIATPTPPASFFKKQVKILINLFKKEGLDAFMDIAYGHAVLTYSSVGEKGEALRYAEMAREAVGMTSGEGAADWRLWDEMVREGVVGHWSWRARV